jgi:hypothetical protein
MSTLSAHADTGKHDLKVGAPFMDICSSSSPRQSPSSLTTITCSRSSRRPARPNSILDPNHPRISLPSSAPQISILFHARSAFLSPYIDKYRAPHEERSIFLHLDLSRCSQRRSTLALLPGMESQSRSSKIFVSTSLYLLTCLYRPFFPPGTSIPALLARTPHTHAAHKPALPTNLDLHHIPHNLLAFTYMKLQ